MAERILEFTDGIRDRRGRVYGAHVEGELREDGRWAGRVRFTPVEAGGELVTPVETVQGDVADLQYWASGLTAAYLEGALERAQDALRLERRGEWRDVEGAVQTAGFRVDCQEDRVPAELLGTFALRPGVTRDLPDGSRIRYTGTRYGGADGSRRSHLFELEFRDRRDGAEAWLREQLSARGVSAEFER